MNAGDYWMHRADSRCNRCYLHCERARNLYRNAVRRWGMKDARTGWYRWRMEKEDARGDIQFGIYNEYVRSYFEDPSDKLGDHIKMIKREHDDGLRFARTSFGISFHRK